MFIYRSGLKTAVLSVVSSSNKAADSRNLGLRKRKHPLPERRPPTLLMLTLLLMHLTVQWLRPLQCHLQPWLQVQVAQMLTQVFPFGAQRLSRHWLIHSVCQVKQRMQWLTLRLQPMLRPTQLLRLILVAWIAAHTSPQCTRPSQPLGVALLAL